MAAAYEYDLPVCKPWGDSRSFDVVVGRPGHFVAVQVKSTICELCGGYACTLRGCQSRKYTPGSFDFLAAYVVMEDAWYIVPAELIAGKERISLASESERAHYEAYREAWYLLKRPKANKIDSMQAGAEDTAGKEFVSVMAPPVSALPRFAGMLGQLLRREIGELLYGV